MLSFNPDMMIPIFCLQKKFRVEKWGSMYLGLWFPSTLLQRGVIKEDIDERDQLLAPSNIGDYFISNFFLYMSKSLVKKSNMTTFFGQLYFEHFVAKLSKIVSGHVTKKRDYWSLGIVPCRKTWLFCIFLYELAKYNTVKNILYVTWNPRFSQN